MKKAHHYVRIVEEDTQDPDYIRLVEQSAVKTFKHPEKDLVIVLAGAIHLGEEDYFTKLYGRLNNLDKILYEGAGKGPVDEETKKTEGYKLIEDLKKVTKEFADAIGLSRQEHAIDEDNFGSNWEHCDFLFKENVDMFHKYSEDFNSIVQWKDYMENAIKKLKTSPEKREEILQSKMDTLMEVQEQSLEEILEDYSFTINARNQKVKERLKDIMKDERIKTVGILYGVLHMPDFENYVQGLGFKKKNTRWYDVVSIKRTLDDWTFFNIFSGYIKQ